MRGPLSRGPVTVPMTPGPASVQLHFMPVRSVAIAVTFHTLDAAIITTSGGSVRGWRNTFEPVLIKIELLNSMKPHPSVAIPLAPSRQEAIPYSPYSTPL